MGQKTHPVGFRLGIVKTWDSRWFAKKNFSELLKEDIFLKRYLKHRLFQAGISKIVVERKASKVTITIRTARPGLVIGRKGERLSALQHLVNLMLSRRLGEWTRVLVDVEDYRGRRERQLREIAFKAADRVAETGKMLQLEPMPALERRWIHLALRENPNVATQSIGEEPHRRVVILRRQSQAPEA